MSEGSIATLFTLLFILLLAVVTLLAGVKTVPQGQEWTLEQLGRYMRTLLAGAEPHRSLC